MIKVDPMALLKVYQMLKICITISKQRGGLSPPPQSLNRVKMFVRKPERK